MTTSSKTNMEKIKKELANIFGYVEQLSPKEMELLGVEDIKRMRIGNLEYRMVLSLIKRVYTQAKEAGRKECKCKCHNTKPINVFGKLARFDYCSKCSKNHPEVK